MHSYRSGQKSVKIAPAVKGAPTPMSKRHSLPRAWAFMSKHFVKTVGSLWARARLLSNGMSKPRPSKGPGSPRHVKTGQNGPSVTARAPLCQIYVKTGGVPLAWTRAQFSESGGYRRMSTPVRGRYTKVPGRVWNNGGSPGGHRPTRGMALGEPLLPRWLMGWTVGISK